MAVARPSAGTSEIVWHAKLSWVYQLGLPELRPAPRLYALLVERGALQPAKVRTPADPAALVAWLPAPIRDQVGGVIAAGRRLAQEWLGRELLREVDLSEI